MDIQTLPWIETQFVVNQPLVDSFLLELDGGEAEAIVLAMEMKADLLLLGVLVDAKHKGLIDTVKPLLDDMTVKAGFWVSSKLYIRVLQEVEE